MPLTAEIKVGAIRIRREHRLKLPDAIIAATSIAAGCPLFSTDETMARIAGLTLVNPKVRRD